MKRRDFIKKAGLATSAGLILPTILPSGRLFASTGYRKANHVVFCLFAGGVRNLESVQKAEGNLMPYTLYGSEAISSDISAGMSYLPQNPSSPLQTEGTLFKEFRFKKGSTGHYGAHAAAITGNYILSGIQLSEPPPYPTVFELYRKHNSPSKSAVNAWWISDSLGPYPYLNYSNYDGYGPLYGANSITPWSAFKLSSHHQLSDPRIFHPEEFNRSRELRSHFDNQFGLQTASTSAVSNNAENVEMIQDFLIRNMDAVVNGLHTDPWGVGNGMNSDMYNIFYAAEVLKEFKPELLVVNMQDIDAGHTNFTQYCDNIRKADFAISKLWQEIQSTPGLADDTVLIVAPEHGRNLAPNTIMDQYGRYALDHTNDEMSKSIFCLILGSQGVVNQGLEITSVAGETIDIVPTIANILGFENDVPSYLMPGRVLNEAFV